MNHIKDLTYRGHELVIIQAEDGYIVDVRADDYDGEMIAGFTGFDTAELAEAKGKIWLDEQYRKNPNFGDK